MPEAQILPRHEESPTRLPLQSRTCEPGLRSAIPSRAYGAEYARLRRVRGADGLQGAFVRGDEGEPRSLWPEAPVEGERQVVRDWRTRNAVARVTASSCRGDRKSKWQIDRLEHPVTSPRLQ